jgi:hypothetical protein
MATLLALLVSAVAAYIPIAMFGDSLSLGGQVMSSTAVSVLVYTLMVWFMRRMRDGL